VFFTIYLLIADVPAALPGLGRRAFLLDGSSLDLPDTLAPSLPAGHHQNGPAHWPMVRLVVAHDLLILRGAGLKPARDKSRAPLGF